MKELLAKISQAGIELWSDRGQLRYRAPKGALTPALKVELKQHKEAILELLDRVDTPPTQLNLAGFFERPTLASLERVMKTALVEGSAPASMAATTTELEAEAVLDATISPPSLKFEPIEKPSEIFLTGATGFLGIYLLYELLIQTQANIHCLVRAANVEAGKQRLQSKLKSYQLWQEEFSARIIPILGDLSRLRFGLTEDQFQLISRSLEVIYHNGALVNFVYPYTALKAPNVLGTHEVIRLASTGKIKPVHFVSTIGVFLSNNNKAGKVIYEQDSIDHGEALYGGYAQSKWVAEKLVTLAQKRGLPVSIYRPGTITGHSITGVCNPKDWLSLMLKSCIQLGMIPEIDTVIEMTPVDYVSRGIVYLSQQQQSVNKAFHLVNPHSCHWNQLTNFIQSFGYEVQQVSFQQWINQINSTPEQYSADSIQALLPSLQSHGSGSSGSFKFDSQNAVRELAKWRLVCPSATPQLLNSQLSYFIRHGFLTTKKKLE